MPLCVPGPACAVSLLGFIPRRYSTSAPCPLHTCVIPSSPALLSCRSSTACVFPKLSVSVHPTLSSPTPPPHVSPSFVPRTGKLNSVWIESSCTCKRCPGRVACASSCLPLDLSRRYQPPGSTPGSVHGWLEPEVPTALGTLSVGGWRPPCGSWMHRSNISCDRAAGPVPLCAVSTSMHGLTECPVPVPALPGPHGFPRAPEGAFAQRAGGGWSCSPRRGMKPSKLTAHAGPRTHNGIMQGICGIEGHSQHARGPAEAGKGSRHGAARPPRGDKGGRRSRPGGRRRGVRWDHADTRAALQGLQRRRRGWRGGARRPQSRRESCGREQRGGRSGPRRRRRGGPHGDWGARAAAATVIAAAIVASAARV
eukprot:gene10758-biopygen18331